MEELFAGRPLGCEMIILCVRWSLHCKLSFRDLVEILTERSLLLAPTKILRCARRCIREFTESWRICPFCPRGELQRLKSPSPLAK